VRRIWQSRRDYRARSLCRSRAADSRPWLARPSRGAHHPGSPVCGRSVRRVPLDHQPPPRRQITVDLDGLRRPARLPPGSPDAGCDGIGVGGFYRRYARPTGPETTGSPLASPPPGSAVMRWLGLRRYRALRPVQCAKRRSGRGGRRAAVETACGSRREVPTGAATRCPRSPTADRGRRRLAGDRDGR
jgi:hypothetical protein